jgi:hypothetical protein
MPVSHLLQTEIVQSEIIDDSNPNISSRNLQDDLNKIRSVIRSILGRDSWTDISGIKTIDFLTDWFNRNVLPNGGVNANIIDYTTVSDVDSYPAVLRNSSTWIKLEALSYYINSQNKLSWAGISFTNNDIDYAISSTNTVSNINASLTSLRNNINTLQTDLSNISTRVSNVESTTTALNTRVTNLESTTVNLSTRTTVLESQFNTLGNIFVSNSVFNLVISGIERNLTQANDRIEILENSSLKPYGNLVIFNGQKLNDFLNGNDTSNQAVAEASSFYYSLINLLGVVVREIVFPVDFFHFFNNQSEIESFINEFFYSISNQGNRPRTKISLLVDLKKIESSVLTSIINSLAYFEDKIYRRAEYIYFSNFYEAKVCTNLNDPSSCTDITEDQARALKRAIFSSYEKVGLFTRDTLNLTKLFDPTFLNISKKFKDFKFRLITNFFNIYNEPYTENSETYYIDVSKLFSKLENDLGIEVFYLDDLPWLERYDLNNMPTVNGFLVFNRTNEISSLFGSSIDSLDKVVQALKASKRKIALLYDYLDDNLSTFSVSQGGVLFNLSDQSLLRKYIIFNNSDVFNEEINEILYEKVSTLTKNKHYISILPGEKVSTSEAVVKEIYVVSNFGSNANIKLTKSFFGELASTPSLTINIDSNNNTISVESSSYPVSYSSSSYNFLKISIGSSIDIFFNDESTPIHTSSISLENQSIVITLENAGSINPLQLYGIFKR